MWVGLFVSAVLPNLAGSRGSLCAEPERTESSAVTPAKQLSAVDLFSTRAPAVVKLVVYGEGNGPVALGSGFVITAPSPTIRHILTNYHVIRAGVHVEVEFHDGSSCIARELLAEDPSLDLAVLTLQLDEPRDPAARATIDIRNAEEPPVGTRLYAIGSPVGMKNTLSDGLLSGYRSEDSEAASVQITTPISPGSSGGPVFTDTGAFVGITTATMRDAQNVNFAVSAKKVREFVARGNRPRPLWQGSCIHREEQGFFRKFYEEVYQSFRKNRSDLPASLHPTSSDPVQWMSGSLPFHGGAQFLEYCSARAKEDELSALILMASFHRGAAKADRNDAPARLAEAEAMLKRALPLAGDAKFFILFKMADVQGRDRALRTEAWESALANVLDTLQASRDLNPRFSPTLYEIANTLFWHRRFSEALPVSEQLVRLVPNSAMAHLQKALILKGLGSSLAAIDELRNAVELNPYDTDQALHLGTLLSETGQKEKAIDAFRQSVEAQKLLVADAIHRIRRECEARRDCDDKEYREYVVTIKEYHRVAGQVCFLHWWIARELIGLKRFDEAVEAYQAALDAADGMDPDSRVTLEQELAACRAVILESK